MTRITLDHSRLDRGAGGIRRRAGRLLAAGAALGVAATVAFAGGASADECTATTLFGRLLCSRTAPAPTTTTTTAPLLPPVTLPPVTVPPVIAAPTGPRSVPEAARHLLDLANDERRRAGLGTLTWRDDVAAIAQAHSERMAKAGDIFHNDGFFSAAVKSALRAVVRGENVAYNSDIDTAHARLMASPGHRANILDGAFSVAGFAVVQAADGRYFITEDFIQPSGAPVPSALRTPAPAASRRSAAPAAPKAPATPPTTTAPAPPTTVAPVPAPAAEATPPQLTLQAVTPEPAAAESGLPGQTVPLASAAALLLGCVICASWVIPRRRRDR